MLLLLVKFVIVIIHILLIGSNIWTRQMYLMFRCTKKKTKQLLYALYYSWENNRFGNQTWKCQGEGINERKPRRKPEHVSVCYCPPSMSMGVFLNPDDAEKEKGPGRLIVNFAFFAAVSLFYSVYTFIFCAAHVTNKCTMNIVTPRRDCIMSRQS